VAGNQRAREGLAAMKQLGSNEAKKGVNYRAVLAAYRRMLFGQGQGVGKSARRRGERTRLGIDPQRAREVLAKGGHLGWGEMLRVRVRYFTDGAILGSREFVDRWFEQHRENFGPRRKNGARKMAGGEAWGGLRVLRELRVRALG
jgi:putative transposase